MGDWSGLRKAAIRKQEKRRLQKKDKTSASLEATVPPAKKT
jgi:hypothetical protein